MLTRGEGFWLRRSSRGAGAVVRVVCDPGYSAGSNGAIGDCCAKIGCGKVGGPLCPPAGTAAPATLVGQEIG